VDEPAPPLVLIDSANVVGSVPDKWWRDRVGATERLRDSLRDLAANGLTSRGVPDWARRPPLDVVLVVEGVAGRVAAAPGVRVHAAEGSGDDAIVDLVRAAGVGRRQLVVTADRALRERVTSLGAEVVGPQVVRGKG
jgi:hypothetical protein